MWLLEHTDRGSSNEIATRIYIRYIPGSTTRRRRVTLDGPRKGARASTLSTWCGGAVASARGCENQERKLKRSGSEGDGEREAETPFRGGPVDCGWPG